MSLLNVAFHSPLTCVYYSHRGWSSDWRPPIIFLSPQRNALVKGLGADCDSVHPSFNALTYASCFSCPFHSQLLFILLAYITSCLKKNWFQNYMLLSCHDCWKTWIKSWKALVSYWFFFIILQIYILNWIDLL